MPQVRRLLPLVVVAALSVLPAASTAAAPDEPRSVVRWLETASDHWHSWFGVAADESTAPPSLTTLPDIDPDGIVAPTGAESPAGGSGDGDALPNIDPDG